MKQSRDKTFRLIGSKKTLEITNIMGTPRKKASAKASVKFKDLKSKKNPKGGTFGWKVTVPPPSDKAY
jgi:hypothetical protein